ncbi:MAG: cob(I)yrinic acid a,c-diamide adenosyltransferase [Ignavibacteria bacterium]|jgi:cob(I)alamin adenosyltransferase|nr:cob(I)yrinic acid a,c-diamide adenosyltransferase [Ignavibacteria bacterium]
MNLKIYTKTGDSGETGLFGGARVSKDDLRIEAYGTTDELNAVLGVAGTEITSEELKQLIKKIQNVLFVLGSDLATPLDKNTKSFQLPRISADDYLFIENQIDFFESKLEELKNFILPGGTKGAAILHLARTICRRAERRIVSLQKVEDINPNIIIFVNRLSDLLFVLSRYENLITNQPDIKWEK